MLEVDAEIVVVGAGITGLSTAYELSRRSRDVVVLEQFAPGHARGSSHGASRVFRLSYPDPRWVRRAQEAHTGWRRWESELGATLLRTTGSIDVGAYAAANRRALTACGAAAEQLVPRDALRRFGLRLEPEERALHQPDAGVISAARVLDLLAAATREVGVRIEPRAPVERLVVGRDVVHAVTSSRTVTGRAVVVAAGPWATSLLATVDLAPAVRVTRETVVYLDVDGVEDLPVLVFADRPAHTTGHDVGTYALADGPASLKVGLHHGGPESDPEAEAAPDDGVGDWALDWAAHRLADRAARLARLDTCFYTSTFDERFLLQRHGRIVVGSACSGHAFKFAPLVGTTLAELAVSAASPDGGQGLAAART